MQATTNDRPHKSNRGFTLLEMLVAVTIVLILVALVIPARNSMLAGGKTIQCVSKLKSWSTAISLYSSENQGVLVANQPEPPYEPWASLGNAGPYWRYFIKDNLKEASTVLLLRRCPAESSTAPSYAFNKAIHNLRLASILRPGKTPVLVDCTPNKLYLLNTAADWMAGISARHANKANVLFLDGHVETLAKESILALRQDDPTIP